jgi:hypothetical protein
MRVIGKFRGSFIRLAIGHWQFGCRKMTMLAKSIEQGKA